MFVLDDDDETREVVGAALSRDGHQVTAASTFDEAAALLDERSFDVLVLDVMLGGEHTGLELCTLIREKGIETPALFLSARGAVTARIEGFEAGGDDYLPKPFALKELVARVRALGRRRPALSPHALVLGGLTLDFAGRKARTSAGELSFTAREWDVLEILADARGRVVPFDSLLERAWGDATEKSRASLAVIVSRLRQKIASVHDASVIRTMHGVGYSFELDS